MCGIAGVSLKRGQIVKDTFLRSLSGSLSHRGPDGEGFIKRNGLGLVHRRLSIIDVEGGAQGGSVVAGSRLDEDLVEQARLQNLAVSRAVERDATSHGELPACCLAAVVRGV